MTSLREKIQASQDITKKEVRIPEWDVTVFVRSLTALERVRCSDSDEDTEDPEVQNLNFMARMICAATVDVEGKPVFQKDDFDWLRGKSSTAFNRLFNAVAEVNGAREILLKNLPGTPNGDSPSG